jgi:hypothetical protein
LDKAIFQSGHGRLRLGQSPPRRWRRDNAGSFDIDGLAAGVTVGANYQINRIILGVEGDWS